jgi:RNA polymerase sigma-70 factor (ECF subfamily)
VELYSFDRGYFERLRAGHSETESHFVSYFSELLLIKLRARFLQTHAIEDIRQETFVRVLAALRKESGIQQPERLGPFVNSVCNNVLLEYYRSTTRHSELGDSAYDVPDETVDLDGRLISDEAQKSVRKVLDKLSPKDRDVLRAVLLEEGDKDQLCLRLGVDRDYLRVLVHRAKQNFKSSFEKTMAGTRTAHKGIS